MRDYRRDILKSVYSKVNGSIVVDGETIETVSNRPETDNYVLFYIDTDDDISTDDSEIRELQVAFDCVSIQPMQIGDDTKVDEMVNQVKQYFLDDSIFTIDNWDVVTTEDNGTEENIGEVDNYSVFERIFSLKIIIERKR
jgi:hypothetical protein